MSECEYAFDHQPNEICPHCKLETDEYCNTEDDFLNCCFPNCGCDGERLCMAPNGANENSIKCNVEGMDNRKDIKAVKAKMNLYALVNPSTK